MKVGVTDQRNALSNCSGSHASSDKECHVWTKEKEIQRVRVEQRIPFPEARRVVEAKSPPVVSAGISYSAALSGKRYQSQSVSVSCQTDLSWVFSDVPKSVGTLAISIAVQAASVISASSSVVSFEDLTETFQKTVRGPALVKTAAKGSADPSETASKGQADPPQTAPKGSADPSKTAPSKVRSKSGSPKRRSSLQGVRTMVVDGASVRIDTGGILNPSRSHQSKRPPLPPKPKLVPSNRKKRRVIEMISL